MRTDHVTGTFDIYHDNGEHSRYYFDVDARGKDMHFSLKSRLREAFEHMLETRIKQEVTL